LGEVVYSQVRERFQQAAVRWWTVGGRKGFVGGEFWTAAERARRGE